MTVLHRLAERIRKDEPISPLLSAVLHSATPIVRVGMILRSWRSPVRVNARVISIGNITAGGTGKTPAVIERARREIALGKKVAVLTRGYGGGRNRDIVVFDDSQDLRGAWKDFGDEPVLIAKSVPEALIVKSADRVAAARYSVEKRDCDTLILDDGYQYLRLARDENIVLIDATNPFGNGCLIPRGVLREPITHLSRTTAITLTHADRNPNTEALEQRLAELCPDVPITKTRHAPQCLISLADKKSHPLEFLRNKEIAAVCAIANPQNFFHTLESLGAKLVSKISYPDHADFSARPLPNADMVVTTEKDAVRFADPPENLFALRIVMEAIG